MSELYDIKKLPERTFPMSFKIIDQYQQEDPILRGKLKCTKYIKGSFHGGRITINLVTFNDNIFIPRIIQRYAVKWYHVYLLHLILYITESIIHPHLYWSSIRKTVQNKSTKCDVCQRKTCQQKNSMNFLINQQKKYRGIKYV